MTPIESIYEIKSSALELQRYLTSKDAVVAKKAQVKYVPLVDRFFRENVNFIEPEQRQSCLDDFDYFLRLMESTAERYYLETENPKAYPITEESLMSGSPEPPEIEYGKKTAS